MADLEDAVPMIDGKSIDNLRVVDLKQELKKRGLSISGSKSVLVERLMAQMYLERLQQESVEDGATKKQIVDESVASNSFIQQYLQQQQELLRQGQTDKEHEQEEEEGENCPKVPAALADQVEELHQSLSRAQSQEDKSPETPKPPLEGYPAANEFAAADSTLELQTTEEQKRRNDSGKEKEAVEVKEDKVVAEPEKIEAAREQSEEASEDAPQQEQVVQAQEKVVQEQAKVVQEQEKVEQDGQEQVVQEREQVEQVGQEKVVQEREQVVQEQEQVDMEVKGVGNEMETSRPSEDHSRETSIETAGETGSQQDDISNTSVQTSRKKQKSEDGGDLKESEPETVQEFTPEPVALPKKGRRWSSKSSEKEETVERAEGRGYRSSLRRSSRSRVSGPQEEEKAAKKHDEVPEDSASPRTLQQLGNQDAVDTHSTDEDTDTEAVQGAREQDKEKAQVEEKDSEPPIEMDEVSLEKQEYLEETKPCDENAPGTETSTVMQQSSEEPANRNSEEVQNKDETDQVEEPVGMETEEEAKPKNDESADNTVKEETEMVTSEEKVLIDEFDKSSKPTPIAVKTRRIALGTSKDKEEGPSDRISPGVTPPQTRKRRWGTTKNLTHQTKKLNVNISTDMLKEIMPEMKQTSIDSVTLETDDKQPSLESSDEDDGEPEPKRKEPTITRTITQVVTREESEGSEGSSDEEGQVDRDGKEDNGKADSSEEDRNEKAQKSNEEDDDDSDSDSDPGEDDGEKGDEKTEDERRDEKEERQKLAKEKAARREEREAAKQKAKMEKAKEKEKKAKAETLHAKKTKLREVVRTSIDDPIRVDGRPSKPSPSRRPESNIVHVMNLVRPYTLNQLKELLGRSGLLQTQDGFWIDNIKSHCFAEFGSVEEAVACRDSLHGTKWPSSNPKTLRVDFATKEEMDRNTGRSIPKPQPKPEPSPVERPKRERRPSEKERETDRDREKERDRQGRPPMREWDRDRERSLSRERRRHEREKRHAEQKAKEEADEPPAKLLDDLFRKTKSTPCIYWLPLTEEQIEQKVQKQNAREKDREERRQKMEEQEKEKERAAKVQEEEEQLQRRSGKGRRHSRSRSRSRGRRH